MYLLVDKQWPARGYLDGVFGAAWIITIVEV
jgi:hypothetical protein